MAYGAPIRDNYRQAADYVAADLRGAKPAELPIGQPAEFDFVVNLKTAEALGLALPPALLAARGNDLARSSAARVAQHDAVAAALVNPAAEFVRGGARLGADPDLIARQRSAAALDQDRIAPASTSAWRC